MDKKQFTSYLRSYRLLLLRFLPDREGKECSLLRPSRPRKEWGGGASGLACAPPSLWENRLAPLLTALIFPLRWDFPIAACGARKARLESPPPRARTGFPRQP